ncbi:MAG: hypothetical protein OHK0013_21920 [Sandaracinaceae bacterium]
MTTHSKRTSLALLATHSVARTWLAGLLGLLCGSLWNLAWITVPTVRAQHTAPAVVEARDGARPLSEARTQHRSHGPSDVTDARGLTLPSAPEGFVTIERDGVWWEMPERAQSVVEPLFETWADHAPRIRSELGLDSLPPIRIRVAIDPEQMRALAPLGAPPPAYAVGVAYPGLDLILLTLTAPETWQRPELDDVLVHELSHIALHHAAGPDHDLPLWFVEGVAIYQARERSIERVQTLWEGAFRGAIIDLDHLDERFPQRPHAVDLAYAQSADFVAWLLRRSGPEKLGEMIGRMRRGQRFEVAVSQTWSAGIGQLEQEWRADLSERFGALPLFATGSAGWIVVGLLVGLAWRQRKRKAAEIEARWAREDAQREERERAYLRWRARQLARERRLVAERQAVESAVAGALDAASDAILDPASEAEPASEAPEAREEGALIGRAASTPITSMRSTVPGAGVRAFIVRIPARSTEPPEPPPKPHDQQVEAPAPPSTEDFARDLDRGDRPLH